MTHPCSVACKPDGKFLVFNFETGKRQGPPDGPFAKERALTELVEKYRFTDSSACRFLEQAERNRWANTLEPHSDSFIRECGALAKAIVGTHLPDSLPDAYWKRTADFLSGLIIVLARQNPEYRTPATVLPAVQALLSNEEGLDYATTSSLEADTIRAAVRFAVDHANCCKL